MLVRYKHMNVKPGGVYLVVPFEARVSASLAAKSQKVLLNPFGELPDVDALKYVAADPHNFEIVKDATTAPMKQVAIEEKETEGVEIHDDKPQPKKRGRKPKAELAAMAQAEGLGA